MVPVVESSSENLPPRVVLQCRDMQMEINLELQKIDLLIHTDVALLVLVDERAPDEHLNQFRKHSMNATECMRTVRISN